MYLLTTAKYGKYSVHDERLKVARYMGYLLHEKSFWGMVAILALIAGMLTLIAWFGSNPILQNYYIPYGS